jgi:hypothetical protein
MIPYVYRHDPVNIYFMNVMTVPGTTGAQGVRFGTADFSKPAGGE